MTRPFRIGIIMATCVAIFAPLLLVLVQSMLSGPFFAQNVRFTPDAFTFVFTDGDFWRALRNSAIITIGMTVIAVSVGAILAFLFVRSDLPGTCWLEPLMLAPMFISSLVLSFGFVIAFGPVGIISLWVRDLIGFVPWNLYSMHWLILIAGLTHVPHVFIYVSSALRSLGSDVEDARHSRHLRLCRIALRASVLGGGSAVARLYPGPACPRRPSPRTARRPAVDILTKNLRA